MGVRKYTYGEILRFRMLACCSKKSERYKTYRQHKEIIEERMEIVNFIRGQGHASLLTKFMIKPHQHKLISHLRASNEIS